jgi:predicted metalloprotease
MELGDQRESGNVEDRRGMGIGVGGGLGIGGTVIALVAAVKNQLDPGDVDEALTAASAIGDDRLQQQSQGRVVTDSFTHGPSAQRVRWFKRGMDSGRVQDCDTFAAGAL